MQNLRLNNYSNLNLTVRTALSSDIAKGVTVLPVENSAGFINRGILVGAPGSERSEIVTGSAVTDPLSIPVAATTLQHNASDPVFLLFGSQLKIYSADDTSGNGTQPADAAFSNIDTIDINDSDATTPYTDSAGTITTWYKFTYYDPISTEETALADSGAAQAGQPHYVSLDDIRSAAGFDDAPQVTDQKISKFRDSAEKEINGALNAIINFPLPQPPNPIIVQIAKNIAAGELMQDEYNTISPVIANQGSNKSSQARAGGGGYTALSDLVNRTVVLQDANYADITTNDAPGFTGYPDNTANDRSGSPDETRNFTMNEEY